MSLNLQGLIDASKIAIAHYKLNPDSLSQKDLLLILGDINHFTKYPWRIVPDLEALKLTGSEVLKSEGETKDASNSKHQH